MTEQGQEPFLEIDGGYLWRLNLFRDHKSGDDAIDGGFAALEALMFDLVNGHLADKTMVQAQAEIAAMNQASAWPTVVVDHPRYGPLQLTLSGKPGDPLIRMVGPNNTLEMVFTGVFGQRLWAMG